MFCLSQVPQYNQGVLAHVPQSRLFLVLVVAATGYCAAACTQALGPGYTIDKQEIRLRFVPDPQPRIRVDAEYRLRNDGSQPLSSLELRLASPRRFRFADPHAEWDAQALPLEPSPANARNVQLTFPQSWVISAVHTLRVSVEYQPAESNEDTLSFSSDAFYLPAEGWSPQLLPARGIFATGGVPPKTWLLTLRVPDGFLVHTGGRQLKDSRNATERTIHAVQQPKDGYPFVIAGRFHAAQLNAGPETVNLWTRTPQDSGELRQPTEALVRVLQA